MTRLLVGPFNRVEGDLEVNLDIDAGRVTAAYANSTLYRGFENILKGRPPLDALVIAPRICGICSVSQSLAAASALRNASGLTPPPNGWLASNIAHAAENVADDGRRLFKLPEQFLGGDKIDVLFHEIQPRFQMSQQIEQRGA